MKKIIFVFCICFLIMQQNKLNAQATWNFNHTTWHTIAYCGQGCLDYSYVIIDTINPDTIINTITYKKIMNSDGNYILGIRSDNHKLYGIDPSTAPIPYHEYLMYDFSANVGDTVYNVAVGLYEFAGFMDTANAYILAKDSFLLNNKYYQSLQVELHYPSGWIENSVWYENIGSENGLIAGHDPEWNIPFLECYSNNDSIIDLTPLPHFSSDFLTVDTLQIYPGDTCFFIPLNNGIEENLSQSGISIYPIPTNGKFTIENTTNKIESIKITNLFGETVFQSETHNSKSEINLSDVPKGIYFVTIENETQNVINRKIIVQ